MNITLRLLEQYDLTDLLKIENDQKYWHLSGTTKPYTLEELSNYIMNAKADISIYKQIRFVIDADHHFAGLIDLYNYNDTKKEAGVGIILLDEFQNKKIGQTALNLLKTKCINEIKLHSLFAIIETDNINSIKLFESCNFDKVHLLSNYLLKNNEKVDCAIYKIDLI